MTIAPLMGRTSPAKNCTVHCTSEDPYDTERNYWTLLLLLFPVFTVFGNILVLMSVYKERSLQTVTNYFIVSLAVADLLLASFVMPFAVYYLVRFGEFCSARTIEPLNVG
ncbi:dopamine D2-like receptor [Scylla paramamosain]|uniref:dopamine D2-like receptor n=1 Tax=Scylla paramamosain TaxID=85552 RepID=UPI003082C143